MATFEVEIGGQRYDVEAADEASAARAVQSYVKRQRPQPQAQPDPVADDRTGSFADPRLVPAFERNTPRASGPETGPDVVKSLGAGLARGAAGIAALPGDLEQVLTQGLDYVAGKFGKPGFAEAKGRFDKATGSAPYTSQDLLRDARPYIGDLHKPQTTAGEYARTVGEFAPGALLPGGVAQRALNSFVPAIASETSGQVTEGTPYEGAARFGAALLAPTAARTGMAAITPVPAINPERARLAGVMEAEGVNALTAGQRTGNKTLQYAEAALGDAPLAGGRASAAQQRAAEQFTEAALRRAGVQGEPRATAAIVDATFDRLGTEFDRLARSTTVSVDRRMMQELRNAEAQYHALVPDGMQIALLRQGHPYNIIDELQRFGTIPGDTYQSYRSTFSRLSREATEPQMRRAFGRVVESMDDAMARQAPAGVADEWRNIRNQYRNLMAIEDAVRGAASETAEGLISPQRLKQAVEQQNHRSYIRGQGDFADLARAGASTMRPLPQSGTANRAVAMAVPSAVGAAGGSFLAGETGAAMGAIAGGLAPGAAGRVIMSAPVQAYLSNQLLADLRRGTSSAEAMAAATPGAVAGQQRDDLSKNDTYRWLIGRGLTPEQARSVLNNPQELERMLRNREGAI